MNIFVCIKQVPSTNKVEVDEKTGVLKRDGVASKMNPYDLYALETALRLKEKHGGKITVGTMGPPPGTGRDTGSLHDGRGRRLCVFGPPAGRSGCVGDQLYAFSSHSQRGRF